MINHLIDLLLRHHSAERRRFGRERVKLAWAKETGFLGTEDCARTPRFPEKTRGKKNDESFYGKITQQVKTLRTYCWYTKY